MIFIHSLKETRESRQYSSESMEIDRLLIPFTQNKELLEFALSRLLDLEGRDLLHKVGVKLYERFERTGSIDDINRAITIRKRMIGLIPISSRDRATHFNNLGIALLSRFERTGSMDDERARSSRTSESMGPNVHSRSRYRELKGEEN
jgi:hypothetical protein